MVETILNSKVGTVWILRKDSVSEKLYLLLNGRTGAKRQALELYNSKVVWIERDSAVDLYAVRFV